MLWSPPRARSGNHSSSLVPISYIVTTIGIGKYISLDEKQLLCFVVRTFGMRLRCKNNKHYKLRIESLYHVRFFMM